MPFLITLFARWGLPEWLRKPLAYLGSAIALLALLWLLKGCYDRRVIAKHEEVVKAEVETKASEGASAAASASASTKASVEAVNAKARDAAAKSDDPLKAGIDAIGKK